MDIQNLGDHFKSLSRKNLVASLLHSCDDDNILVTTQEISKVLNFLAPFLVLKELGGFERSIYLDLILLKDEFLSIALAYRSFTIIVSSNNAGIEQLTRFWSFIDHKRHLRINIIVQNLTKSFYYQILQALSRDPEDPFAKCIEFDTSTPIIHLSSQCKILSWKTYPALIQDNVLSLDMENGGLSAYLDNPLQVVSSLCGSIMEILSETMARREIVKIKNIYGKGDHSSLLARNLTEESIPEFLCTRLTQTENEFYLKKQSGNTDLVIIERNLDYFPLLLSHTNYMGLLDDIFGTEDELNNVLSTKDRLNDELFDNLKHLNFGSVGVQLNKLAKFIQLEIGQKDKVSDLLEIKQLVKSLGSLSSKQEMIRKHTHLSEMMLLCIKSNKDGTRKFNSLEMWYELQNDLFDLDYKQQVRKLHSMIEQSVPFEQVMSLVVLISLINDGWRQSDMDSISASVQLGFGLKGALSLKRLLEHKIVKVNTKGNDFFGSFTFGKTEIETTTVSTLATVTGSHSMARDTIGYGDLASVGISSGQDVYKSTYTLISKFWNLHPLEDVESDGTAVETVLDYKHPSFALPSATVPLIARMVELLYSRDFLTYKPVVSVQKRPNWQNLNIDTMFKGQTIDENVCDTLDEKRVPRGRIEEQYVILVLLGGITRSEMSALQYLQGKLDRKILVVTTGLVNNKKFWRAIN